MSFYATGFIFQVENTDEGGWFEGAWDKVWFQHVPNHINEQNGYSGPAWDDWLPAFKHKRGCEMRKTTMPAYGNSPPYDYYDCDCGSRAVFVVDNRTKKGTERCGQEYVNPVLVLTGLEYERARWSDLMQRIEERMAERRPKTLCLEPGCAGESVHTVRRKGKTTEAWCTRHDSSKFWRGQKRRRCLAEAQQPRIEGPSAEGWAGE